MMACRTWIILGFAVSILFSTPAVAAEFLPLGPGAWETSGEYRVYGREGSEMSEFVYPVGETDTSRFEKEPNFDDGTYLPGGVGVYPAKPTTVWHTGFTDIWDISDDGRVIVGRGQNSLLRYTFDAPGEIEAPLDNRMISYEGYSYYDMPRPFDLSADGESAAAWSYRDPQLRSTNDFIMKGSENLHLYSSGLINAGLFDPHNVPWTSEPEVTAISGDGLVVTGSLGSIPLYTQDRSWRVLDGMELAIDLSHDGTVIVGGPKRWTAEEGAAHFGPTPTDQFQYEAVAVSGDGTVIAGDLVIDGRREAFRWTAESGLQSLGTLGLGRVTDLSADGSTIVGTLESEGRYQPFRWHATTGIRMVSDLVVEGGDDLAGYDLESATYGRVRVSGDGTVLVGAGYSGGWLARVAIVPEPSASLLCLHAAAGHLGCRRRKASKP